MASCPECGKILPEGYKICPACGGSIAHLKDEITAHINLMRKKAEREPTNSKLHMDLGNLYQTHGLILEARDEYQRVIAAEPGNFDAHFKLAQIYIKLKQGEKAEKEFNAALHINPKSVEVLIGLFRSDFLQGKIDPAIILGEKILQSKPDSVEFHKLLMELYGKKNDKEKVLRELLTLSALIPEDRQVIREITVHYIEINDMEKAAVFYGRMMNMAADDPFLGIQIGKYYFERKEYDRVIEYMAGLLEREDLEAGMESTVRAYLALAHLNKDAIPEALSLAEGVKTLDLQEMKLDTRKMLGAFFFKIGQTDLAHRHFGKAIAHFEKAVHFEPETAEFGQLLEKTRNEVNAAKVQTIKKAAIVAAGIIIIVLALVMVRIVTRGQIVFQIDPPETVMLSIDGKFVKGTTGKGGSLISPVLAIGKHRIVVEKEGYEKWIGLANIGLAKSARLTVKLVPAYYALRVSSLPESSDVMIDDRMTGTTPFANDRVLARGHTVAIVRENYAGWCTTFTAVKNDSIDLGTVTLKNLAGEWRGKIGNDAYTYNAAFRMTVKQKGADLTIKYVHQPMDGQTYSGEIKGKFSRGELIAQGDLVYNYYYIFYWKKIKRKIALNGKISEDWNRIEGKGQVEGLGDRDWWAERGK